MTLIAWFFFVSWFIVLYAYIGFPVLLATVARLTQSKGMRDRSFAPGANEGAGSTVVPEKVEKSLPRVAMVVAAYNEERVIAQKLANTWEIDYPADRFEIWIGSDGSSDETGAILKSCPDARLRRRLYVERRGKISVLNELMSEVDADIVVMSDANTMYSPDAVRKLVEPFSDPSVGCVSGELSLDNGGGVSGEGIYWKYENWIKRNESRLGFLIGCNGGIYAIRRGCYEPLPPSTIVEDFVLSMRILERRHKVLFRPDARAVEPPTDSSRGEMVRKIRIGAGAFQALGLTWRVLLPTYGFASFAYWGHKVLRWFAPLFLILALVANVVLVLVWRQPLFALALAAQLIGVFVAALAYRETPGRSLPRWTRPISYFYLMNYSLFCGFLRFLFRTQRVTWDRVPPPSQSAVEGESTQSPSTEARPSV